jgi:hypothetical protein
MLGGVGSPQTVMQHSRHLERAGYLIRETRYVGRGLPRVWLELTSAGYSALGGYRDDILNMFIEPIAPDRLGNAGINSMEINSS